MSQDDDKQSGKRKAAGKSRSKSPPARAPGKPSTVQKDRLPTAEERGGEAPQPRQPNVPLLWVAWGLMGLGALVFLSFFALNIGGGSSSSAPTAEQIEIPEESLVTPQPSPTNPPEELQEEPPPAPSKPSPPEKVWEHEITAQQNTSFNIDNFPIRNLPTGFVITDIGGSGQGLEVVAVGKQIAWKGSGTPTYKNCVNTLGSTTGTEHISLQNSGEWICVETATQRIGRLRFDSASGYAYRFQVTVWRPSQ